MIKTEIYIEGNRLDLSKDISMEITYAVDDIKDFAARNCSFSKTIVIPGNGTNNKIFGHLFEFGSANIYSAALPNVGYNYNAAKSASCLVYVDKVQVFKGVLRLMEIVIDNGVIEYECAVFGELGGFVSALGNGKIEELDFSTYNHVWNVTNIQNSWNTVNGSGYYYPLIDYGKVGYNSKHDWDVRAFRPALYVKEYLDKIIAAAGYTYSSTFMSTALFKRLIIPQNGKFLMKTSAQLLNASIAATKTVLTTPSTNQKDVYFDTTVLANVTENGTKSIFTYTGATTTSVNIFIDIAGYYKSANAVTMKLFKNGTAIETHTEPAWNFAFTRPYRWTYSGSTTLSTSDTLRIEFFTSMTSNTIFFAEINTASFTVGASTSQVAEANYGDSIDIGANIPKGIFQKDFFSSIVKMFNLYVTEDANKSKHLVIEPYVDFYDTAGTKLDWTYKVDRAKPIRIKPMSEINGRYFEFKYKGDSDYYNDQYSKKWSQGYGDYLEDTGYEFAKDKQTAEIIFAATPLLGYAGEEKILPTIFKLSNNVEDATEHVIRIMQAKKVSVTTSYAIKDTNATSLVTATAYGYAGHLDDPDAPSADINFGAPKELYLTLVSAYPSANLFNSQWSEYVAEITAKDSKLLSCSVRIKDLDIYGLDFKKLIFIDGGLWRLNKVSDYNPMEQDTTKVELLKVIELTY